MGIDHDSPPFAGLSAKTMVDLSTSARRNADKHVAMQGLLVALAHVFSRPIEANLKTAMKPAGTAALTTSSA